MIKKYKTNLFSQLNYLVILLVFTVIIIVTTEINIKVILGFIGLLSVGLYFFVGFRFFSYTQIKENQIKNRNFARVSEVSFIDIVKVVRFPLYANAPMLGYTLQLELKDNKSISKNFIINENNYTKETLSEIVKEIQKRAPEAVIDEYYVKLVNSGS